VWVPITSWSSMTPSMGHIGPMSAISINARISKRW
jgi:hypothetical protein